jgi:hypothetical protein
MSRNHLSRERTIYRLNNLMETNSHQRFSLAAPQLFEFESEFPVTPFLWAAVAHHSR